jgi:hypothetical protein
MVDTGSMGILEQLFNLFRPQREMISPIPEGVDPELTFKLARQAQAQTEPPAPKYRHDIYNKPLSPRDQGVKIDELLSGTAQASQKYNVPQDLLMDIPAIESSGGQFPHQLSGGPGRGPYQFEVDGEGKLAPDLQRLVGDDFNVFSATDSADLAGRLISQQGLSRWGTPKMSAQGIPGGTWGSLDNQKKTNPLDRLSGLYDPKTELNPYLTPTRQF